MRTLAIVGGGLVLAVVGIVTFYAVALRTKQPLMLGVIRRINRRVFNPHQMKTAGTPDAYASIVRHVGRVSGVAHETPIVVRELDDRFVVVLPYGRQADWVRNLCAAGHGQFVTEGRTWDVEDLQFLHLDDVLDAMPANEARNNRWAGCTDVMTCRRRSADIRTDTSNHEPETL